MSKMRVKWRHGWLLFVLSCLISGITITYRQFVDAPVGDDGPAWADSPLVDALSNVGAFFLLVACIVAFAVVVTRAVRARRARKQIAQKRVWRYREMSRKEKRRIFVLLIFSSLVVGVPASAISYNGGADTRFGTMVLLPIMLGGIIGNLTGMVGLAIQLRPSRTVMRIVEERTKHEVKTALQLVEEMRAEDARNMEKWKNETISKLYAMIMDQVERGVISCSKCADIDAATLTTMREGPALPAPRTSEDASKSCNCAGPTSLRVIYPPRFQSKRTAS